MIRRTGEQANGEPLGGTSLRRALLRIAAVIVVGGVVVIGFVAGVACLISLGLSHSDAVARREWMAEVEDKMAAIQEGRSNSFGLYQATGTDGLLERVAGLAGLEEVWLDRTDVTDEGIRRLAAAPHLRKLHIRWCPHLTDAALEYVSAMPALEHLALFDLAITDRGIGALRRCSTLRRLEVFAGEGQSHGVTPLAMTYFGEFSQLRVLEIKGSWVTKEAVEELHQSLPNTTIIAHMKAKTVVLGEHKGDRPGKGAGTGVRSCNPTCWFVCCCPPPGTLRRTSVKAILARFSAGCAGLACSPLPSETVL